MEARFAVQLHEKVTKQFGIYVSPSKVSVITPCQRHNNRRALFFLERRTQFDYQILEDWVWKASDLIDDSRSQWCWHWEHSRYKVETGTSAAIVVPNPHPQCTQEFTVPAHFNIESVNESYSCICCVVGHDQWSASQDDSHNSRTQWRGVLRLHQAFIFFSTSVTVAFSSSLSL
jgi:hypothetical protein